MKLVCLDVANATTQVGLFDGPDLVDAWRLQTVAGRTADEWATLIEGGLHRRGHTEAPDGVCLSSTVPAVLRELRLMLASYDPERVVVLGPGVKTGIKVRTDHPREVGADRIAGAVAAADRWAGTRIVVGFGTATTLDCVNSADEYVGGAIAPGLETSMEALGSRAAQLAQVELQAPPSVVGRNTVQALQSGVVLGAAAMTDGLVARMLDELGVDEATVVATGPLVDVVAQHCRSIDAVEPWLTLYGLRQVHARTCPGGR